MCPIKVSHVGKKIRAKRAIIITLHHKHIEPCGPSMQKILKEKTYKSHAGKYKFEPLFWHHKTFILAISQFDKTVT